MKTLYLVRHAKSSWKDVSLQDHERPLNKRGKKSTLLMGMILKEKNDIPDLMISSPAKRAISTAKRMAKELNYHKSDIKKARELYMGWNTNFINVISSQDNQHNKIMIFSHNPGITEFANYISDSDIDNIPTCGVVKINFEFDSWGDIKNNKGNMEFFEYPKKHEAKR